MDYDHLYAFNKTKIEEVNNFYNRFTDGLTNNCHIFIINAREFAL